jgi:hypothetical protein
MKLNILKVIYLVCLFILIPKNIFTQTPNPQSLLEKWDRETSLEDGTYTVKIIGEGPALTETDVMLFSHGKLERFFLFLNSQGEAKSKFYSDSNNNALYLSFKNRANIFKLSMPESIEKEFPETSFSYYELSGFQIEKTFTVENIDTYSTRDRKYWKINVVPIVKNTYGKLTLYSERDTLNPYRIDFFSPDNVLTKILRVRYGKISVESKDKKEEKTIINEYEMTFMENSEKSFVKILSLKTHPLPEKSLFNQKNLTFINN